MPQLTLNGTRFHYNQSGNGPDIVLIHGLAANLAFWYFAIVPLLARDFRVTVYDLRGHGYSDMPPSHYSAADMAADLHALLDALGISRAHLVGHSFGGLVALHFATLFPDQAVTLTIADTRIPSLQRVPQLREWPHWKRWNENLSRLGIRLDDTHELDYGLLETLAHRRRPSMPLPTSIASFFLPFGIWSVGRRGSERWLRLLQTTTAPNDFRGGSALSLEAIREVRHPSLAIFGQYSFCLPSYRGLLDNLACCTGIIVPRVGHFHPIVKPASFLRHLRGFLGGPARTPGAQRRGSREQRVLA